MIAKAIRQVCFMPPGSGYPTPRLMAILFVALTTAGTTAQVVTPSPTSSNIVGGTPTVAPKPVPTPSGVNTDQHASRFVGTWDLVLIRDGSKALWPITLKVDGTFATDAFGTKEMYEQVERTLGPTHAMKIRWENRWRTSGEGGLILTHMTDSRDKTGSIVETTELEFHEEGPAGPFATTLIAEKEKHKMEIKTDRSSTNEFVFTGKYTLTRKTNHGADAREVAGTELTPSPTSTPTPQPTNTPAGREAMRDALRRDPAYANMTEQQLNALLDKIDHADLARWSLSDAIRAEREYWESLGMETFPDSVIRPTTPKPTPTPSAELKYPYDWISHVRKEADLSRMIEQFSDKLRDGLDADREIREQRDTLRRQLEALQRVRNEAMRNPTRYVPRVPPRR